MNTFTIRRFFMIVVLCVAMTPIDSFAVDVTFPNTDGSWKILSPSAWSPYDVPTTNTGNRAKFVSSNNATYIVDRDGSLNGMYIDYDANWNSRTYTFQFENDAKLTIGDKIEGGARWAGSSGGYPGWCTIRFNDGDIDFLGNALLKGNDQAYWLKLNFNGCTVTNVDNMWMTQYSHDYLAISNSTVWINHVLMPGYSTGPADTRIFIGGGSKVSAGQFTMSRSYNGGSIGVHTDGLPLVDISGTGTEVVFRGNANTGNRGDDLDGDVNAGYSLLASLGGGEIFRIRDGAKVTVANRAIIGIKKGANNRVVVEGEGSELNIGEHAFAWKGGVATGSTNNYIVVRNGGKLVSGTAIYNSGSGSNNGIICSNGVVSTRGPKYNNNNTGNRLTYRMQGDNPSVTFIKDKYNEGAYLTCGLNWVFDLPASSYRAGCVPFRFDCAQYLQSNADSANLTCEINCLPGFCADMKANGEHKREVILINGGSFYSGTVNGVSYSSAKYDEAVARWNDELQAIVPNGFSAELVRSGTKVTLKVKQCRGMVMVVK